MAIVAPRLVFGRYGGQILLQRGLASGMWAATPPELVSNKTRKYGHARQKPSNKANALSQSRRQNQPSTYFEQALNQPFGLLTVSSKAPKNDLQSATPDCARTFACWLQLGVPIGPRMLWARSCLLWKVTG
ncbi:hypothetical protein PSTG_14171 [Puccinia striiformis f. sp. tritici PST-78]|uniref:Uncharacterized protein n=1 Tax=Puccinia striiformis f. sp. tritici PST-78 TaxID=1165861 RepID=A0A0L0UZJ5_9BASI|nr:hypothetical protein PSTG_14171 [Puccinia striiformis f. sp. tritici PST-78]